MVSLCVCVTCILVNILTTVALTFLCDSFVARRDVARTMFSGIVEEMGSVSSLIKNDAIELWDGKVGEGVELTVKAKVVLDGATNGCSICVNGVCLTVVSFDDEEFKVISLRLLYTSGVLVIR